MRYPASWEKRRDARLIYAIRICILYLRTRARAGFSSVFLVHVSPPSLTITAAGASRGHGKTIARQFARGMAEKNHSRRAFSLPELILSSICGRFRYFPPSPPPSPLPPLCAAARLVPFLVGFLCNFLRSARRASGTKGLFPVHRVTRSRRRAAQTKRDYPDDERVIKTKYGSELTIYLFAAVFHVSPRS
jgi:hypothetical protein